MSTTTNLPNTPEQGNAARSAQEKVESTIPLPPSSGADLSQYQRERIMEEVKEHLDLLDRFDGAIPAEEIRQRKRELFLAMPPAPPPLKRCKESSSE